MGSGSLAARPYRCGIDGPFEPGLASHPVSLAIDQPHPLVLIADSCVRSRLDFVHDSSGSEPAPVRLPMPRAEKPRLQQARQPISFYAAAGHIAGARAALLSSNL